MISDFVISDYEAIDQISTDYGKATRLVLEMTSKKSDVTKTVWYDLLSDIDDAIVTTTFFSSTKTVIGTNIVENEVSLANPNMDKLWSYNGGGEGQQSW